ncbi:hypothetical protein GCM10023194_81280 [Planotetraspora phitsanulokensis]|uniref:Uncharacterized protein n=1 Tax=Planotetraspora phitsanulokensis TaxID=575192 RepID=A0A8J3XIZ5_9ACTN|nr:hypothetical protein [Planotetraspora phitsanulokensis]GII42889.1 hypothetical protein Pph01_78920 [Planotetraspora phitsanulokensis]
MIIAKYFRDQDMEFRSAADVLRWLAANTQVHGSRRSVKDYWLTSPEDHGDYWLHQRTHLRLSKEDYARVYRLQKRYRQYVRHMEEDDPEWEDGEKTYWMDNSVDVEQHSRKYPGLTRTRQLVGPHGDACF